MGMGEMLWTVTYGELEKLRNERMAQWEEQRRQIMERAFAISLKGTGNTTQLFDGYLDMSSFKLVGTDEAYALAMEPDMDTLDKLLGEMTMEEAIADMRKTVNAIPEERA